MAPFEFFFKAAMWAWKKVELKTVENVSQVRLLTSNIHAQAVQPKGPRTSQSTNK